MFKHPFRSLFLALLAVAALMACTRSASAQQNKLMEDGWYIGGLSAPMCDGNLVVVFKEARTPRAGEKYPDYRCVASGTKADKRGSDVYGWTKLTFPSLNFVAFIRSPGALAFVQTANGAKIPVSKEAPAPNVIVRDSIINHVTVNDTIINHVKINDSTINRLYNIDSSAKTPPPSLVVKKPACYRWAFTKCTVSTGAVAAVVACVIWCPWGDDIHQEAKPSVTVNGKSRGIRIPISKIFWEADKFLEKRRQ